MVSVDHVNSRGEGLVEEGKCHHLGGTRGWDRWIGGREEGVGVRGVGGGGGGEGCGRRGREEGVG